MKPQTIGVPCGPALVIGYATILVLLVPVFALGVLYMVATGKGR